MSEAVEAEAFDARYIASPDPWGYETDAYELGKYARTLASLPDRRITSAVEIGCSNGELTRRLAERCVNLLSFDFSTEAVRLARRKIAGRPGVRIERRDVRGGIPSGPWDLVIASEVLYYLARADVDRLAGTIESQLAPGGSFLAVHWRGEDPEAPLDGREVHALLHQRLDGSLSRVDSEENAGYFLDRWERPGRI